MSLDGIATATIPWSRKGIPNKLTADLKAMILGALDDAGGRDYLRQQAHENPAAFMVLLGNTLPKDVNIESNSNVNLIDERAKRADRILEESAVIAAAIDAGGL